jgi:hypothetical protein
MMDEKQLGSRLLAKDKQRQQCDDDLLAWW